MFLAALVSTVLLVGDPARGLLLGITPTLFALLVWALTNRAGYTERVPETLAHERTAATVAPGEVSAWDPFERDRPVSLEASPAPTGGDSATTPSETTAPDDEPERPATGPGQKTTSKATRHSDPNGPGQQMQKPATAGKAEAVAKRPTPSGAARTPPVRQPNLDVSDKPNGPVAPPQPAQGKASSKPAPSKSGTTVVGKPGKVRDPNPSQPQPPSSQSSPEVRPEARKPAAPPPGDKKPSRHRQKDRKEPAGEPVASNPPETPPPGKAPTPGSTEQAPPAAQPPSTKGREPTPPSESARDAVDKKRRKERSDASGQTPTPARSDQPGPALSPAEAAKRDAEARKSKKRKGKPDEAA
jgi:hypothetical protein